MNIQCNENEGVYEIRIVDSNGKCDTSVRTLDYKKAKIIASRIQCNAKQPINILWTR